MKEKNFHQSWLIERQSSKSIRLTLNQRELKGLSRKFKTNTELLSSRVALSS